MSTRFVVNIVSSNNEDLRQAFQLTDTSGTAIDLAGASLVLAVATGNGQPLFEATTENDFITLSAPETGTFELAVPAAAMHPVQAGVYRHDLLLTRAGTVKRLWAGTLTVEQGVAR